MDAEVTIKFVIKDICEYEESKDDFFCLEDLVQDVIDQEGFYELLEQDDSMFEIVDSKLVG